MQTWKDWRSDRVDDSGEDLQSTEPFLKRSPYAERFQRRPWYRGLAAHLVILLVYTGLTLLANHYLYTSRSSGSRQALPDISAPRTAFRAYSLISRSQFVGPYSNASKRAWQDLLAPAPLRISADELRSGSPLAVSASDGQSGFPNHNSTARSSVTLPAGGVLAWLGVWHELHCIKVLYEANYREQLHPDLVYAVSHTGDLGLDLDEDTHESLARLRDLQVHVDHCIDQLREAAMCRADVDSLTTFTWREGYQRPLLSPERPGHWCVNWDEMLERVKHRVVLDDEMEELLQLGPMKS